MIVNLVVICLLTSVQNLSAQTREISGVVTNSETGKPIGGVSVVVKGTSVISITDDAGYYKLSIPDTINTVVFSDFPGMTIREVVVISKNVVNIKLVESVEIDYLLDLTLEELMNVKVVSASKFEESISETPATILVIKEEDIKNRGYTNLNDVFMDIPGFDISAPHGDIIQLAYARGNRTGSYSERTMLMIDGIEHNMLFAQFMHIDHDFPLSSIERIEVIYGPASAVYGPNSFSGIINIITKSPDKLNDNTDRISGHTSGGSFNTQTAELTYLARTGELGISFTYRRHRSDRFDITDRDGFFSEGDIIGNPRVWGPYAEYYPEFDNKTNANAIISKITFKDFKIGYNKLHTVQGSGSQYPYDKTLPTTDWKFNREILYLKYNKEITDNFDISFLTTYQKSGVGPDAVWAQGWTSANDWDSTRTVELLTWKFISYKWSIFEDFVYKPFDFWIINGGVKYASGNFQKSYEFGFSDQITWLPGQAWTDPDVLFPQPVSSDITPGNTFTDTEWGGFIQNRFSLINRKLNLILGLRYDDNSIYGDSWNPRIGATFKPTGKILLKTSYGSGFMAPAPRNLYGGWGGLTINENLDPEEIQAVDFSFITTFKHLSNDLTVYYNEITKSILQGENLPKKSIVGFEYKLNLLFPTVTSNIENFRAHFNYTFTNAKYEKERTNSVTGRSSDLIGDIAKNKFNLILDADFFKNLHLNLRFNYVGERQTIVSNPIEKVDPYLISNLSLHWNNIFKKDISVFCNVNNLLDKDYYHTGIDSANAGEDTTAPSLGWYSSRLPQPGRYLIFGFQIDL